MNDSKRLKELTEAVNQQFINWVVKPKPAKKLKLKLIDTEKNK